MGLASDLIQRAADVTIKEGRKLVLLLIEPASDTRLTEHLTRLSAVPNVVLRSVEGFSAGANPSMVEATTSALLAEFGIGPR
jgi:flavin prenyltransferase